MTHFRNVAAVSNLPLHAFEASGNDRHLLLAWPASLLCHLTAISMGTAAHRGVLLPLREKWATCSVKGNLWPQCHRRGGDCSYTWTWELAAGGGVLHSPVIRHGAAFHIVCQRIDDPLGDWARRQPTSAAIQLCLTAMRQAQTSTMNKRLLCTRWKEWRTTVDLMLYYFHQISSVSHCQNMCNSPSQDFSLRDAVPGQVIISQFESVFAANYLMCRSFLTLIKNCDCCEVFASTILRLF